MPTDIDSLQIQIDASSESASKGIDALIQSLEKLKTATDGVKGLKTIGNGIGSIAEASKNLTSESVANISNLGDALAKYAGLGEVKISSTIAKQIPEIGHAASELPADVGTRMSGLASGLQSLSGIQGITLSSTLGNGIRNIAEATALLDTANLVRIETMATSLSALRSIEDLRVSSSIANQIVNLGTAAELLAGVDFTVFGTLATSLEPLTRIGDINLSGIIRQLNRIPELANTLNGVNWTDFTEQIQHLCDALAPLTTRLNEITAGFSGLPAEIRRLITATNNLSDANNRTTNSYVNLWARARMAFNVMRRGVSTIASWINESNKYIEDVNLFTVSLGKYAQEAQKYAEQVSEIMGIDPAEWLRNQGVFNTIVKGFGVANDKAYLMSKNLTQLGYDLSSFYNISVEDAMTKLQSGIAGELEPLRRLGYDLSVARLQEEALALGITKKVSKMNQAEKSQLRYYAILTQVKDAQGDMARTLEAPANQLRILQAQLTQCARAFGNIFIPVLNMVLPYLIAMAKVVRYIAETIADILGIKLPEVDYSGLAGAEDAAEGLAGATGDADDKAKKLKRTLMGFDELNALQKKNTGKTDTGTGGTGGDLGIKLPEYDFLGEAVRGKIDAIVKTIKDALHEITTIISGFLLAIGTILVVTGANIPLGLGLMVLGAAGLAAEIAIHWNGMSDRLARVLALVTGVIGGFLLAIGAFLTFTGANIGLGIALMALGAASLAAAVAINWKFLNGDLKASLATITAIVSGALLGLGALFALTGINVPLGIALMVAGAAGIVTAVGLNWDILPQKIKDVLTTIMGVVGGALLAVGAAFAFTGVDIPLGIALMAAGAVALGAAVALNWEALSGNIERVIRLITAVVSGGLLAIGAVLAFSGGNMGLGIGLMIAGAVGLAGTVLTDWDILPNGIHEALQKITTYLGVALLAVGAVLAFTGNLPLGIGLMVAGAASLASGAVIDWDGLVGDLNRVLQTITTVVSGAMLAIGAVFTFTGVSAPLGIAMMIAGAVGLASSVALDWDLLPEKISGVLKALEIVVSGAALALGAILTFSGFLAIGIPLMVAGAAGLVTGVAANWGAIVSTIRDIIQRLGAIIGTALLVLGVILTCAGILPVGIPLIVAGIGSIAGSVALNWGSIIEKVTGILSGIGGAISAFASWIGTAVSNIFSGIGNAFSSFGTWVSNSVSSIWSGIQNGFSSFTGWLGGAVQSVGDLFHNMFSASAEEAQNGALLINESTGSIKASMTEMQTTTSAEMGLMRQNTSTTLQMLQSSVVSVWNSIKNTTSSVWASIRAAVTSNMTASTASVQSNSVTMKSTTQANFSNMQATVQSRMQGMKSAVTAASNGMKSQTSASWSSMASTANAKFSQIQNTAISKMNSTTSFLSGINWTYIGSNLVQGLWNGIMSVWSAMTAWVQQAAQAITDLLNSVWRIGSPSKEWEDIGEFLIEGLELGMENEESNLLKTTERLANGVNDAMSNGLSNGQFAANGGLGDGLDGTGLELDMGDDDEDYSGGDSSDVVNALDRILTFLRENVSGGDTQIVIDGREVFRVVVNENNRAIQRTGASPIRV